MSAHFRKTTLISFIHAISVTLYVKLPPPPELDELNLELATLLDSSYLFYAYIHSGYLNCT